MILSVSVSIFPICSLVVVINVDKKLQKWFNFNKKISHDRGEAIQCPMQFTIGGHIVFDYYTDKTDIKNPTTEIWKESACCGNCRGHYPIF